ALRRNAPPAGGCVIRLFYFSLGGVALWDGQQPLTRERYRTLRVDRGWRYNGGMLDAISLLVLFAVSTQPSTRPQVNYQVRDLKMTLVRIEPGEFVMGSPPDEAGREDNELQHTVKITKPFYLGTTEVSQAQYQAVMGENPSYFQGDDLPVENVSWEDANR